MCIAACSGTCGRPETLDPPRDRHNTHNQTPVRARKHDRIGKNVHWCPCAARRGDAQRAIGHWLSPRENRMRPLSRWQSRLANRVRARATMARVALATTAAMAAPATVARRWRRRRQWRGNGGEGATAATRAEVARAQTCGGARLSTQPEQTREGDSRRGTGSQGQRAFGCAGENAPDPSDDLATARSCQ